MRTDYDTTPYTSNSFPQSAPGQLAAIAHLFGLETPEVAGARVLEIGCAAGGNVIPFAATHPQARVMGIDLDFIIAHGVYSWVPAEVQEARGERDASTFNLWHETQILSPVDRYLVPLLDGSRDRDALLGALLAIDRENPIYIEHEGKQVGGEAERRDALAQHIDALPEHLAEMKLLRVR